MIRFAVRANQLYDALERDVRVRDFIRILIQLREGKLKIRWLTLRS